MPRGSRPKPSTHLVSDEILKEIKSVRPLRLFINKQKKKGNIDNPFTLRVRFCQLPADKQAKFLQKSVDRYIEILDERGVDENVQIECKLFDYLLIKSEQKKYFQSINAPTKPPGTAVPFYTQDTKQEIFDDTEMEWKSLSQNQRQSYKRMRKEAKAEYSAQIRNFANDLPDRLRSDYLIYAEQFPLKGQLNTSMESNETNSIRQRRKSLSILPDSLQTTVDNIQTKLTKIQLRVLHECMPCVLYYESDVSDNDKPLFSSAMTKNAHMRSLFNQLNEKQRIKYFLKSIKKWNEFLEFNPNIIENRIPTLHLLLSRNEDILLYFHAIGLPRRPPINSYLYYRYEKDDMSSQLSWSNLPQTERIEYSQKLIEVKNQYYEQLVYFIDQILPTDYIRFELFRNIKYAIKDYEIATKNEITDKDTGEIKDKEYFARKMEMFYDKCQFNEVKQRLLSTELTNDQKDLIEQLTHLLYKYVA